MENREKKKTFHSYFYADNLTKEKQKEDGMKIRI